MESFVGMALTSAVRRVIVVSDISSFEVKTA